MSGDSRLTHVVPVSRSRLAAEGLARLLVTSYDLVDVHCQLIKGTIRDTYSVHSTAGPFVLSVYPHGRNIAEITAELRLLDHLAAAGVSVPVAVPDLTGARLLAIAAPEGVRYAVLFTYIPGRHLDRQPAPEPARRYGHAIAQMHTLADALPEKLIRPAIDLTRMLARPLEAIAAVVTDRPEAVTELREAAEWLHPRLEALPREGSGYGLIHGDVIPSNAQVMPSGEVAVLDFDFCGPGWRAYDVATYLGEVRFWEAPATVAEAFLAGYEAVRPLTEWERAALPLLEATRHIQAVGTPAMHVNEWGRAYLSDRMIDTLLGAVRQTVAEVD